MNEETGGSGRPGEFLPGGCILDESTDPEPIWGKTGGDMLWAEGEATMIVAPEGRGKTTLSANLVKARLGLADEVLGVPVVPSDGRILLLLMDRPRQAMKNYRRLFGEVNRRLLDSRVIVRKGPPSRDLAANPHLLLQWCEDNDASDVIVDSLKDAALNLSSDETGSGWNSARQWVIASERNILELHHPKKAQEGNPRPRTLEDVYGSRWIAAGAGCVISLWSQNAGDPVVEFTQIKPLTYVVPSMLVSIGEDGRMIAEDEIDIPGQIRARGANGMTAAVLAALATGSDKPGRSDVEKARRRLDRMTLAGVLSCQPGRPGAGGAATWFLAAREPGSISQGSIHGPKSDTVITANPALNHAEDITAGQRITDVSPSNHEPPPPPNHANPPLLSRGGGVSDLGGRHPADQVKQKSGDHGKKAKPQVRGPVIPSVIPADAGEPVPDALEDF